MTALPLQLRWHPYPLRTAEAMLLPGDDAAAWLQELVAWNLPPETLEIHRLPGDAGLLVLLPRGVPPRGQRSFASGRIGAHLLVPVEAEVHPPLSAAEADRLFGRWSVVYWHPTLGAHGFDRADAIPARDLLALPLARRAAAWNDAEPGLDPPPPLRAIQFTQPLTAQDVYGDAAEDIGSDPVKPDAEPPPARAGEPGDDALSRAARTAKNAGMRALAKMLGAIPHTGSVPTWVNRAEEWLGQRMGRMKEDLDRLRHRAVDRLLEQLAKDPDEGLRRAIPLGSLPGAASRGVSPPASNLANRDVNFDLGRLFASQGADAWSLDAGRQQQLRELYRQLANRELQLGRFRRAAFIFAELLRDLTSAAAALRQGKHFREAAVLYRDKLHQPLVAAEVLEAGGFSAEAIAIYEEKLQWLSAARVYRQLGDEPAARVAFRRGADELLRTANFLAAAQIFEESLGEPREAAAALECAWPDAATAGPCLGALFDLHARHGWAAESRALLVRLREAPSAGRSARILAETLAEAHGREPDREVGAALADLTRVVVSRELPTALPDARQALSRCLVRLAPADRLLARDVNRFVFSSREAHRPVKPPALPPPLPLPGRLRTVEPAGELQIIAAAEIRSALGSVAGWIALTGGPNDALIRLFRGGWEEGQQELQWPGQDRKFQTRLLAEPGHARPILLIPTDGGPFFPYQRAEPTGRTWGPLTLAGTPPWWPAETLAAIYDGDDVIILSTDDHEALLLRYRLNGTLVSTTRLEGAENIDCRPGQPFVLASHPSGYIAAGHHDFVALVTANGAVSPWHLQLSAPGASVTELVPTPRHARAGFAIVTVTEVQLLWADTLQVVPVTESAGLVHAAFTAAGNLVVVGEESGEVFEVGRGTEPTLVATFPVEGVVADVTPGHSRDEFAVFYRDGRIRRHRLRS